MIESWVALLLYGGGVMDDLKRLSGRGIRALFGWSAVPDPTTFGRWLRRGGEAMERVLDRLTWHVVQRRWHESEGGVPESLMLVMDSTVILRYGLSQAGAERGYNPKKPGRPSHHPLVAFTDGGDCLGVRWRAGSAHTSTGAAEWVRGIVVRLREAGVGEITIRLDKGFFSKAMVSVLTEMGVSFVLKVPDSGWVRDRLGSYTYAEPASSAKDTALWTAEGELYGMRLASVERRCPLGTLARTSGKRTARRARERRRSSGQSELELDTYEVDRRSHILSNIPALDPLATWRLYNRGTFVEQRIKELYQLGFGRTAVDDLSGNATLASLSGLAYEMVHMLRTTALSGEWCVAEPERLRTWLFRMPAKLVAHARKKYVKLSHGEPLGDLFLGALRSLAEVAGVAGVTGLGESDSLAERCRRCTSPPLPA